MKKCICIAMAIPLWASLSAGLSACDPEESAVVFVRNELDGDIARLWLTGDGTTGDLLAGDELGEGDSDELPIHVAPGTYRWHAALVSEFDFTYDGEDEIELFPGPNHIVLSD